MKINTKMTFGGLSWVVRVCATPVALQMENGLCLAKRTPTAFKNN